MKAALALSGSGGCSGCSMANPSYSNPQETLMVCVLAEEKGLVSFDLLKTWAKAHLREDSRLRAMILQEQESVSRAEMIVKLDMYNRMLPLEPKR